MMISPCNYNHNHNPSPQFLFHFHFPSFLHSISIKKSPFKSTRRRISVTASTSPEIQTLPQSAIQRISEKLRSLGYVEEIKIKETLAKSPNSNSPNSPGEIFVPFRSQLPKHRVGHTLDPSWSTPENPVPEPGSGNTIQRFHKLRNEALKEKEDDRLKKSWDGKVKRAPSLAELTLPEDELRRLRSDGIKLKQKLKVGKAGITEGIVNGIHERWRRSELVKITCEDICRLNMKRTHELLERKTGGLVIWRSGSNIIIYRGTDYKYPYFFADNNNLPGDSASEPSPDSHAPHTKPVESHPPLMPGVGSLNRVRFQLPGEAQLAEEADMLLEGLGPRFTDWWGCEPLPVDADLLPAIVPGYKRPFRLLPYGVKPKLTNDEMNTLRRLGLHLPCHFVLGRNRKHQGLASAIVKLWEKCEIAKIAIKRGVQNTNSELMAEEIKWLTGGTLLSRDKEFFSLYRGKDFLPAAVSSAIDERRQREIALAKTRIEYNMLNKNAKEYSPEVEVVNEKDKKLKGHSKVRNLSLSEAAVEKTSTKLTLALAKKARAEKFLSDLEKEEISQPPEIDKEGITEEERYMLRKVGLRMKPFLLLGRRGVFDGTVENMHLHWKYRELVKVCIGPRSIEEVHGIARTLEAESGGILVAVERVGQGNAIIVYRGKNYKRPESLRPQTLLSKREAMKRSLEAQRRQSLKLHVLKLTKNIEELKLRLDKDEDTNDMRLGEDNDSNHTQLPEDVKLGSVEQEIGEDHLNEDNISDKDSISNYLSDFEDSKEAIESHETDATSTDPKDFTHGLKGISSPSQIDGKNFFGKPKVEVQSTSALKETKDSFNRNEQREHIELSHLQGFQDRISSSATTTSNQPNFSAAVSEYPKAKLESSVKKATEKEPEVMMLYRATPLSNKERLLLRKKALRMKNQPVLAVGKSNVVTGVAKAINAHFKKSPLAIVNIKGRAKGTSIQEVVYNLEQATNSYLVSQEPSKVILYRGSGTGEEPSLANGKENGNSKNKNEINGNQNSRQVISPELISAIRIECGLKSADGELKEPL